MTKDIEKYKAGYEQGKFDESMKKYEDTEELELSRRLALYVARAVYEQYRDEKETHDQVKLDFPDWLEQELEHATK